MSECVNQRSGAKLVSMDEIDSLAAVELYSRTPLIYIVCSIRVRRERGDEQFIQAAIVGCLSKSVFSGLKPRILTRLRSNEHANMPFCLSWNARTTFLLHMYACSSLPP